MSIRVYILLAGLIFTLSSSVQAGFIEWNYKATIADKTGSDPLGIDGDALSIKLVFDDTGVWQSTYGDQRLWFPTATANATITGHTVALNTATPAAFYDGSDLFIAEEVGSGSFMDLIVDNTLTQMIASLGLTPPAIIPSVGDNLLIGHLTTGIDIFNGLTLTITSLDYEFVSRSITVSSVPEAPILALLVAGLAGMGLGQKKKRECKASLC